MIDYEKRRYELKLIRRVYEFLMLYGKFEIDYERTVEKLGDTVIMFKSRKVMAIDKVIPTFADEKDLYRFLMDELDWRAGGALVITMDRNRGMIYGYDKT